MAHSFGKILTPLAVAMTALTMASPAIAIDTTFASYTTNSNDSLTVVDTGSVVNVTEVEDVNFNFLNTSLAPYVKGLNATLVFVATGAATYYQDPNGYFALQLGLSGTITFDSVSSFKIGAVTYAAGTPLLTVTFSGADLNGMLGGSTADFNANTLLRASITYSSQFLSFTNSVQKDFAVSLTAVTPALSEPTTLASFNGTPTGSFAADPVPLISVPVLAVPEPSTWALVLAGFGAIGLGMRGGSRRNTKTA